MMTMGTLQIEGKGKDERKKRKVVHIPISKSWVFTTFCAQRKREEALIC